MATSSTPSTLPLIAILGRPNVGKSTLFNVLAVGKRNKAVTHASAGTTRDVRTTPARLFDLHFLLADTAGIEEGLHSSGLQKQLNTLSKNAATQADVLLLVLDGTTGVLPADRALAAMARKLNKPLLLLVNKLDVKAAHGTLVDAEKMGFGAPLGISAVHRDGLDDLHAALSAYAVRMEAPNDVPDEDYPTDLPTDIELDEEAIASTRLVSNPLPSPLQISILGRPNVGKSTLVNALLRHDAMLTGPEAGLTREAISHTFRALNHDFDIVDTPGLRKKGKIDEDSLEHLSVGQSLQAAQLAHVIILVVDASIHNEARGLWQVFEQQDATIAQMALNTHKPLVVVMNKWDLVLDKKECMADVMAQLKAKLHDVHTPLVFTISAEKKQGLGGLLKGILEIQASYGKAFTTSQLNRTLARILALRSPPLANGRPVSLKFIRQICVAPPTFAIWGNRIDHISGHYLQFLRHQMAESLGLEALPLVIHLRGNKNPYSHRKAAKKDDKKLTDSKPSARRASKANDRQRGPTNRVGSVVSRKKKP